MGEDKDENDLLIRYGFPEDIWFHVHDLSSAHVYIRMAPGKGIADIPEEVLEDCMQLVKHNSIQGDKAQSVTVVYTPWTNLNKTASMDVGQVGFHEESLALKKTITKNAAIFKALEKTRVQKVVDLAGQKEAREKADRMAEKKAKERARLEERENREAKQRAEDALHYKGVLTESKMKSNKTNKTAKQMEEEFM